MTSARPVYITVSVIALLLLIYNGSALLQTAAPALVELQSKQEDLRAELQRAHTAHALIITERDGLKQELANAQTRTEEAKAQIDALKAELKHAPDSEQHAVPARAELQSKHESEKRKNEVLPDSGIPELKVRPAVAQPKVHGPISHLKGLPLDGGGSLVIISQTIVNGKRRDSVLKTWGKEANASFMFVLGAGRESTGSECADMPKEQCFALPTPVNEYPPTRLHLQLLQILRADAFARAAKGERNMVYGIVDDDVLLDLERTRILLAYTSFDSGKPHVGCAAKHFEDESSSCWICDGPVIIITAAALRSLSRIDHFVDIAINARKDTDLQPHTQSDVAVTRLLKQTDDISILALMPGFSMDAPQKVTDQYLSHGVAWHKIEMIDMEKAYRQLASVRSKWSRKELIAQAKRQTKSLAHAHDKFNKQHSVC